MELLLSVMVVLMMQSASGQDDKEVVEIPKDFLIGTATSAYQIEGAWNESGKGLSVWDTYVHEHPEYFPGNASGNVATDSYHKYKEDVKILKQLNVDFYRFSISWSRILPKGFANHVNNDGIDYYNNLINELIKNNIQCVAVMHHWDLPQDLQDLGGWANPVMEEFFEDYARILFLMFGDRVRTWITFVEPLQIAESYNASMHLAPGVDSPYVGKYLVTHTLIKAHARVYRMYHSEFHTQRGMVGIALNSRWFEPKDNSSTADVEAAERALEFELGIFANPVYSEEGDYPKVVKDVINKLSMEQGYKRSRLRNFTVTEVQTIKGAYDFLGLNYYTSRLAANGNWPDVNSTPDSKVKLFVDPKWPESSNSELQVVPWGIRKLIKWASDKYKSPKIFITENGFSDLGEERDTDRVKYIVSHLSEIMKSKNEDGNNVIGYTVWSLMDSFEWHRGYEHRFGLYKVNRSDPELQRTPKSSAYDLSEICKKRKLPIYFLRVTGEIDVNLTFFDHEKLQNGVESVTENTTEASSTTLTSFINPFMYVWFLLLFYKLGS